MTLNVSAARKLTSLFSWTCINPTRFDFKTNTFVTKPIHLVLNLIALTTQSAYTLSIGVSRQLKSKWYYHEILFVDALSVFFRDVMFLFGYPLFLLLIYSTRSHQVKFFNKAIMFDSSMSKTFGDDPQISQKSYTAIWIKLIMWTIYYSVYTVPFQLYFKNYDWNLLNLIYMCSYSLTLIEIGLACSYIEFCVTVCFRQTDKLHGIIVSSLGKLGAPKTLIDVVKAFDLIQEVEETRRHFGDSFANALLFISEGVTINLVFVLYHLMQQIRSERFIYVVTDCNVLCSSGCADF